MTDLANLTAWAEGQGYDPAHNYLRPKEGYLSAHFREAEFACNHCGELPPNGVPDELLEVLEAVREYFGQPVTITSGYRCPIHNRNVGGAKNSQHLLGTAADIQVKDVAPGSVYSWLNAGHEGGLGRYATFTHIDVRGYRARWSG